MRNSALWAGERNHTRSECDRCKDSSSQCDVLWDQKTHVSALFPGSVGGSTPFSRQILGVKEHGNPYLIPTAQAGSGIPPHHHYQTGPGAKMTKRPTCIILIVHKRLIGGIKAAVGDDSITVEHHCQAI